MFVRVWDLGLKVSNHLTLEMLVFRGGKWHTVNMPAYVDTARGFGDRHAVASIIVRERAKGLTDADAFLVAEASIYQESLGNSMAPQSTKKNKAV